MTLYAIFTRKKAPPCRNVPRFDPARAGGCPPHNIAYSEERRAAMRV